MVSAHTTQLKSSFNSLFSPPRLTTSQRSRQLLKCGKLEERSEARITNRKYISFDGDARLFLIVDIGSDHVKVTCKIPTYHGLCIDHHSWYIMADQKFKFFPAIHFCLSQSTNHLQLQFTFIHDLLYRLHYR